MRTTQRILLVFWAVATCQPCLRAQDVEPPPNFTPGANSPSFSSGNEAGSHDDPPPPRRSLAPFLSGPAPLEPPALTADVIPIPRIYYRAEYLSWWTKGSPVPIPLVTNGGAIGAPGTQVLMGNQALGLPVQGGGRFTIGYAFDDLQTWAMEGSVFFLNGASASRSLFSDGSAGSPSYAFPFFDPTGPGERSTPISSPGNFGGSATLSIQTSLQGVELNLLHNLQTSDGFRFDVLGGFRNVNLQERLLFETTGPSVAPNPPSFFDTFDRFSANNNFFGAQLGGRVSYDYERWFVNATGKFAIGATSEHLTVNGGTFTNEGGSFASANGAYLSQPSNIGAYHRSQFCYVPELGTNIGFRIRPWVSISVGYTFLYLSAVLRPGNQLDRVINPSQAPAITNTFPSTLVGVARPGVNFTNSSFWAQGLNLSLEFRH